LLEYTSIIAAFAAFILAFIAVLNYLSRPILITSIERHTDDIRKLLDRWLEQLPRVEAKKPNEIPDYEDTAPTTRLPVENESLFSDLPKHDKFNVLGRWKEYKSKLELYHKDRLAFLSDVRQEVERQTGLNYDPKFKHGLTWYAFQAVYETFFEEQTDGRLKWRDSIRRLERNREGTELRANGRGMIKVTPQELPRTEKIFTDMVTNIRSIIGDEKYDEWRTRTLKLYIEKRDLDTNYYKLQQRISDFKSIPLMTGKCKYIRRRDYLL